MPPSLGFSPFKHARHEGESHHACRAEGSWRSRSKLFSLPFSFCSCCFLGICCVMLAPVLIISQQICHVVLASMFGPHNMHILKQPTFFSPLPPRRSCVSHWSCFRSLAYRLWAPRTAGYPHLFRLCLSRSGAHDCPAYVGLLRVHLVRGPANLWDVIDVLHT